MERPYLLRTTPNVMWDKARHRVGQMNSELGDLGFVGMAAQEMLRSTDMSLNVTRGAVGHRMRPPGSKSAHFDGEPAGYIPDEFGTIPNNTITTVMRLFYPTIDVDGNASKPTLVYPTISQRDSQNLRRDDRGIIQLPSGTPEIEIPPGCMAAAGEILHSAPDYDGEGRGFLQGWITVQVEATPQNIAMFAVQPGATIADSIWPFDSFLFDGVSPDGELIEIQPLTAERGDLSPMQAKASEAARNIHGWKRSPLSITDPTQVKMPPRPGRRGFTAVHSSASRLRLATSRLGR